MSEPTPPDTTAWPRWGRGDWLKAVLVLAVGAWIFVQDGTAWFDRPDSDAHPPPARNVVQEASIVPPCDRHGALEGPVRPGFEPSGPALTPSPLTLAVYREPLPEPFLIPECVPVAGMGAAPPAAP